MTLKKIDFFEITNTILEDKATGGKCYNAYLTIGEYLKLTKDVYKTSNEFQRRVINIKKSLIYQKLVKDLLRGVVIPTISLFFDNVETVHKSIEIDDKNVQILDGLQRTNCIEYAIKLLKKEVVDDLNILSSDDILTEEQFLNEVKLRVEIWVGLTVNGILYKMVSLNAGQTPMDLNHQFEILELPLKNELKDTHEINIFTKEQERERNDALGFNISNLVEGIIAYNTESIFPRKQATAISIMNSLDINNKQRESTFIKNDYLMKDLVWVIDSLHNKQIEKYSSEEIIKFRGILSEADVFFIPFMAALGKARKELSEERFEAKKELLLSILDQDILDPWDLLTYEENNSKIKSDIGQKRRKMIFFTFYMFFTTVDKIDWNLGNNFI
ncbi:hypothetical protein ACHHV8_35245 [Paenibacillus sp. TAB 01]|uniref:hypothetical protein n=1 Tax=Paenibacillus sp. TAB 01 TaxID=3368988 RepID=UPI0037521B67